MNLKNRTETIELLNQTHEFPCPFTFKVIGENSPAFIAQVAQVAVNALGRETTLVITTRESSGGRHLAVTMVVTVPNAKQVLSIYAMLGELAGVKMVL
ncbi:MAG: DUF493 domain-containing protein [Deltaproteobacteria bacterium]|nr:DUF493 domain-containing protein [Deltaproteobacteria bacterium]